MTLGSLEAGRAPALIALAPVPARADYVQFNLVSDGFVPAANMVVYSEQQYNAASAARVNVARIDPVTGALSNFQRAVWSDGFGGTCNLFSASGSVDS